MVVRFYPRQTDYIAKLNELSDAFDTAIQKAASAQDWSIKMDGKVDGVDYSAKYYANQAATYASSASATVNLARDWATKVSGEVNGAGSGYSAYYWAQQAKNFSGQIPSDWNQSDSTARDFIKGKPNLALKADVAGSSSQDFSGKVIYASNSFIANGASYATLFGVASGAPGLVTSGTATDVGLYFGTKGVGEFDFTTNGGKTQFRIVANASAANYATVSGGASGTGPTFNVRGTDISAGMNFTTKGAGEFVYRANGGTQFVVGQVPLAVNFVRVYGAVSGSGPVVSAQGTDDNIDLHLQAKGTGKARLYGNASTATKLETPRMINGVAFDGTQDITLPGGSDNSDSVPLDGSASMTGSLGFASGFGVTLPDGTYTPRMRNAGLGKMVFDNALNSDVAMTLDFKTGKATFNYLMVGDLQGNLLGNASTASRLNGSVTINGISFNGSQSITVPADASTINAIASREPALGTSSSAYYLRGDRVWTYFEGSVQAARVASLSSGPTAPVLASDTFTAAINKLNNSAALAEVVANKNAASGYAGLNLSKQLVLPHSDSALLSTLAHSNTAVRTYQLPDKSGTVAMTSDIPNVSANNIDKLASYNIASGAGSVYLELWNIFNDDKYSRYMVDIQRVTCSGTLSLGIMYLSGSYTVDATAVYTDGPVNTSMTGGKNSIALSGTSSVSVTALIDIMRLQAYASTTAFFIRSLTPSATTALSNSNRQGYYTGSQVPTGFRLFGTGGNLIGGVVTIYGVLK